MSEQEKRYQQAMNRGHSAAWDQDWNQAASLYRQALDEKKDDPKALTSLALALFKLDEYEKSLQFYLLAAKVSPNDPVPLEKAASLYESLEDSEKASQYGMQAAEKYLHEKNAEKAVENWSRAVANNPENLQAHSRLALVYERLGRKPQAAREYLHIASLMQHTGKQEQAFEAANHANKIIPNNKEAKQALTMLRSGTMLPKPARPQSVAGPLVKKKKADTSVYKELPEQKESNLDPIEEAQREALSNLANLFFDQSSEDDSEQRSSRRGLQAITEGASLSFTKNTDRTKLMLHLGQAVDLQTRGDVERAADELKGAISSGLKAPAAYYSLGLMQTKTEHFESAVRNLQRSIPHAEYALGARLLLGDIWYKRSKFQKAAVQYLEALRSADAQVVSPEHVDELRELYDPLIETLSREKDDGHQKQLCESISELLLRSNWRQNIKNARRQVGDGENSTTPTPLAEILLESSSSDIVASMSNVRRLAREGHHGAALEEILYALQGSPTYLPLHIVLGEVLISKDLLAEAVQKFNVIARAYSIRGESRRAITMLQRVVEMSPMDVEPRRHLIDQLTVWGKIDQAIEEYIQLAEVHYNLAELDNARQAYSQALQLSQQSQDAESWQIRILHRIADINVQSLDWQKAADLYRQICNLRPDDDIAYRHLVDLKFSLGEPKQALETVDEFIEQMQKSGQPEQSIGFLEGLVDEQPEQPMVHYRLATQCQQAGRTSDAIQYYDSAGDLLLEAGDKAGAKAMIQKIIEMNPSNIEEYQKVLDSI